MKVEIKTPCNENWDAMQPEESGKFCTVCNKSVIDFTEKTKAQIKAFFDKHKNEKVCGRFNTDQVTAHTVEGFLNKWQYFNPTHKFATILFLSFGFWLFTNTAQAQTHPKLMGKPAVVKPVQPQTIKGDTVVPEDIKVMGEPSTPIDDYGIKKSPAIDTTSNNKPYVLGAIPMKTIPGNIPVVNKKNKRKAKPKKK